MQTLADRPCDAPQQEAEALDQQAAMRALVDSLGDQPHAAKALTSVVSGYESRLSEQHTTIQTLQKRLQWLEEQVRLGRHQRYGASSEKDPAQARLFDEAEQTAVEDDAEEESESDLAPVKAHRRRRRLVVSPDLPREERVHDLAEQDKVCPHDGTPLRWIDSEDSEEIQYVPASLRVIQHRRQKYACPCCHRYVVTAGKPHAPIPKSAASPSLLAGIATHKYVDGLPLYRQGALFERIGLALSRTNMAHWMIKAGTLVQPIINLLGDKLVEQPVVHMDETPVQVLAEPGKRAQSQSYMWVRVCGGDTPVRLFHYAPTRRKSVPQTLLSADTSTLMADGYEGYREACRQYDITRLGCWAHARRKFVEARRAQPKGKAGRPDQALSYIAKLYRIEKDSRHDPPDPRRRQRQQHACPVLDQLRHWLDKTLPRTPPKSTLGKALMYLDHQWPRLVRYLEDGRWPIDNNLAEGAIRPFAIGRKNWLFSQSQTGARASANLYSLVETAKANGVDPYRYLEHLFAELPDAQSLEAFEALLPWHVKKSLA